MNSVILAFCQYLLGAILFLPGQILELIGHLFPSCAALGIVGTDPESLNYGVQLIRWVLPLGRYLPLAGIWTLINAVILYGVVRLFIRILPWLIGLSKWIWIVIAALYIILPLANFFIGSGWMDSSWFSDAFGSSPTSTP